MNTLANEVLPVAAVNVTVSKDILRIELADGRMIEAPLAWYPRLVHGTAAQRNRWRLIGQGEGIHWPDLDEDVSVENLLRGYPSAESQKSLQKWLASRKPARTHRSKSS